jgi:hypothetical protein
MHPSVTLELPKFKITCLEEGLRNAPQHTNFEQISFTLAVALIKKYLSTQILQLYQNWPEH